MKKMLKLVIVAGTFLVFGNFAFAHEAHEHGVARMDLALEGQKVEITLETPLANVLSFEHAPETEAQKKEVHAVAAVMQKAESLFIFPVEAQCRVEEVSLKSEAIEHTLLAPNAPVHKEKNHSDEKNHAKEMHADLDVEVSFLCSRPEKIDSVTVDLFRAFPNLREIEVRMVTRKGQKAAELTPTSNTIRW
jgi:hypothetical protein